MKRGSEVAGERGSEGAKEHANEIPEPSSSFARQRQTVCFVLFFPILKKKDEIADKDT